CQNCQNRQTDENRRNQQGQRPGPHRAMGKLRAFLIHYCPTSLSDVSSGQYNEVVTSPSGCSSGSDADLTQISARIILPVGRLSERSSIATQYPPSGCSFPWSSQQNSS